MVGAEVLVRWQHPQRGWLGPAEFIPFAERTGRIAAVTRTMLKTCAALLQNELQTATRTGQGGLHLAVNISTADLRDPQLVPLLQLLLEEAQLAPDRLLLEVTESSLLGCGEDLMTRLAALRALGVGVAFANFGSGPSSLACLQRLPATELKIDRSLVADADSNAGRQQLLRSIIDMAHSLDLVVTAEGVETEAERRVLAEAGCDLLQGYLIGWPMPVADYVRKYTAPAKKRMRPRCRKDNRGKKSNRGESQAPLRREVSPACRSRCCRPSSARSGEGGPSIWLAPAETPPEPGTVLKTLSLASYWCTLATCTTSLAVTKL